MAARIASEVAAALAGANDWRIGALLRRKPKTWALADCVAELGLTNVALSHLLDALRERPRTRRVAIRWIGALGPLARAAAPALFRVLKTLPPASHQYRGALVALARVEALEAVPMLESLIEADPKPRISNVGG